jgi:hypothetical protein
VWEENPGAEKIREVKEILLSDDDNSDIEKLAVKATELVR